MSESTVEMLDDLVEPSPNLLILSKSTARNSQDHVKKVLFKNGSQIENKMYILEDNNNSHAFEDIVASFNSTKISMIQSAGCTPYYKKEGTFEQKMGSKIINKKLCEWRSPSMVFEKTDMPKFDISTPKTLQNSFGNTLMYQVTPSNTSNFSTEFTQLNNKHFSPFSNVCEEPTEVANQMSFSSQKNFDESGKILNEIKFFYMKNFNIFFFLKNFFSHNYRNFFRH